MLDRSALRGAFSFPDAGLYWSAGALLLLAWLVPLHVLPWMSWHNEVLAAAAVLVGCLLVLGRHLRAPGAVALPSLAALPLLLALLALAQFLAGRIVYAGSVWVVASYAGLAAAAAVAGHAAGRSAAPAAGNGAQPAADVLAWVVLAGAGLQVLVVFGQTLGLWPEFEWVARTSYVTRGGGNLAQPNHAGLLFVMGIAACFYLHQTGRLGARPVAGALLVLLCAGLATTESRSAMLALAAVLGWQLLRRRDLPRALPAAWLVGLGLLALGLFVAWPQLAAAFWLQEGSGGVNVTTSGRTAMWLQLLQAVALRPWSGWGVMQVAEAQDAIAHAYPEVMTATFSHNVVLDLALWVGLPATALCAWMVVAWLRRRLPQARSAAAVFCIAVSLPLAVQSLTEFPYAYAYFVVPVFFALGLLGAWTGAHAMARVPRPLAAGVLAAGLAMHAWAGYEYVLIEDDFRVARFEALKLGAIPAGYTSPRPVVLTQLGALLRATRLQPRPGMTQEELALLRSVAMLYPWGAPNFQYLTALALNGRIPEANRQLQVLRARHGARIHSALTTKLEEMAVEHPVLKQLQLQ